MDIEPDLSSVSTLAHYLLTHGNEVDDILDLASEAEAFLRGFTWLEQVEQTYVGAVFPGIVGIFLYKIRSPRPDVDNWTWVMVGDVPPAYITCERCATPWEALDGYIGALEEWAEAAASGMPVEKLIPVNAAATPENAAALTKRLKFLDENIMPLLQRD